MDADNVPLQNPERFFAAEQYREHGNLFWPDFWDGHLGCAILTADSYHLLGLPIPWAANPRSFIRTETGQILFNR